MEKKIEKIANKILNEIKKMNLSKEVLRSLDFVDLIDNMLFKIDTKHITKGDYYYYLFDFIAETCINFSLCNMPSLWYCHRDGDYKSLWECIAHKQYFNNQMAEYFNETVWEEA